MAADSAVTELRAAAAKEANFPDPAGGPAELERRFAVENLPSHFVAAPGVAEALAHLRSLCRDCPRVALGPTPPRLEPTAGGRLRWMRCVLRS